MSSRSFDLLNSNPQIIKINGSLFEQCCSCFIFHFSSEPFDLSKENRRDEGERHRKYDQPAQTDIQRGGEIRLKR